LAVLSEAYHDARSLEHKEHFIWYDFH